MQHGSPVETSNVHQASQPCCRNSSGILSNNAALEAESNCYIASGMTWLPFEPQLTFNQLPFSSEDPKPDIGRSTYSHIFSPSAVCLWNTLPVDVCQLLPDSFKAQLYTIALM